MGSGATNMAGPVPLAVSDISTARIPGQYRLTIEPDRGWLRHEVVAWSVGMKWLTFEFHDKVHSVGSTLFSKGRYDEYLRTVEQPLMEKWMQAHHGRHLVMHEAALLHGLAPGGGDNLPVERMLIDRRLKEMVEREGIDVHGPAETIGSNDNYLQMLANDQAYMGMYAGGRHFQLRQLGVDLPELSTWLPLGDATYCGHALDLRHQLPETICTGVVGRRLGDLVSTGIPALDARIITEALTSQACVVDHWPPATETRLYLEPDLVELGSQRTRV